MVENISNFTKKYIFGRSKVGPVGLVYKERFLWSYFTKKERFLFAKRKGSFCKKERFFLEKGKVLFGSFWTQESFFWTKKAFLSFPCPTRKGSFNQRNLSFCLEERFLSDAQSQRKVPCNKRNVSCTEFWKCDAEDVDGGRVVQTRKHSRTECWGRVLPGRIVTPEWVLIRLKLRVSELGLPIF